MVYKYIRKTNQGSWSEDNLKQAIQSIQDKTLSITGASKTYGIPFATLYRHFHKGNTKKKLGRFTPVFTSDQESELVSYLKYMDSLFYGLTRSEFLTLAYDYAESNKIPHPFKDGKAGEDWLSKFKSRHPDILLRVPESTSLARTRGFNKTAVDRFFSLYSDQLEKLKCSPDLIFNMDETGIFTTVNKPPKIFSVKGKKQVGLISSTERGQLTTVVCCCNAAGSFIPPFFIFARKRMNDRLMDDAPPGSQGSCTASGWMNGLTFLTWVKFFLEKVRPTPEKKALLLLDNLEAHKFYPALQYASQNNVVLLSFAPHTTHRMQPLDVSVFGPLKKNFEQHLNVFLKQHAGRVINQFDVCKIFSPAYQKSASSQNAISGFKKTGIWPYDPLVFTEEDFLPSTVTSRPIQDDVEDNPVATTQPSQSNLMPHDIPPGPSVPSVIPSEECSQVLSEGKNIRPGHSTSIPVNSELSSELISSSINSSPGPSTLNRPMSPINNCPRDKSSPFNIRPVPSLKLNTNRKRRRYDKSEVLTSTPIKLKHEEKYHARQNKELSRPKGNLKRRILFKNTLPEKKRKEDENGGRSKKKCRPTKGMNKSGKPKGKTESRTYYQCFVCAGQYGEPPFDDWIQCGHCQDWAHEGCTAYTGTGSYFCEYCHEI